MQERCLRRRLNTCNCQLCLDVCASGALSFVDRQLQLDLKKCTGCMACGAVCPSEALVTQCDLEEVLRTSQESAGKRLVISCIRKKQLSVEEIAVPCLAIFAEESLLALGMSKCSSIAFNLYGCSECENKEAAARFLQTLRRVQGVAAEFLTAGFSVSEDMELERGEDTADRRSFLAGLRSSLATFARDRLEFRATPQPKTSGRRIPVKVKIIEKAIASADVESQAHLLTLCTHQLSTSPSCTGCPLCTGICPTGALRIHGSGAEKKLLFISTRCSGCGLCVSFCKVAALSLSLSPLSG